MKALVTGGGGFLGGAVARKLAARGDYVKSFSRDDYPELADHGINHIRGDIADPDAVSRAVEGCDVVFHVAAKAGVWGSYESYYTANVAGTRNVLSACEKHGIGTLIYTSSPSVVFDGRDEEGVDESEPYPEQYMAHYPATKAIAEKAVIEANRDNLATVALRPHLIWGPGDPHLVPRIVARAKAGRLRALGRRENKVDSVYVDNAADAHLLAADRIDRAAGKIYFITNDEPLPVMDLINRIVGAAGLPPVTKHVPVWVAYAAGAALEGAYSLLRLEDEPFMTRFVVRQLSTAHWFDITAAKRDLGYTPTVSIEEGIRRLADSFSVNRVGN